MKRMFLSAAIVCLLASNAWAGYTCQRFGNQVRCWDNSGNTTTCQQFGNQTRCW